MQQNYSSSHQYLKTFLLLTISAFAAIPALAQRQGFGGAPTDPAQAAAFAARRQANRADSAFVHDTYKKLEVMIPMRDGVKLYTQIYVPKDSTKKFPIMLDRSPYGSAPYGATYKTGLGPSNLFMKEGIIF